MVRANQAMLLSIARSMGLRDADAVDVVQLAWFKLFQHLRAVAAEAAEPLRNPAGIRAWLVTTTRNAAYDLHRKRRPTVSLSGATADDRGIDPVDPEDATTAIEERELRAAALRALEKLDDSCRELIELCIADPPLSYDEIGEILGRPVGSLGPTRQRCLEKLRLHLKGEGYE